MRDVLVLQHHPVETAGLISEVLTGLGIGQRVIRTFAGERVPNQLGAAVGLVVMGGPMGVYEHHHHPHLRDEMRLIEDALRQDVPLLGICLGSQLLAAALGADVHPGPRKEIGWHAVTLSGEGKTDPLLKDLDETFVALHWHGDVYDLPNGAVRLATSELTPCQAFRHGSHAYGFLFHMEMESAGLAGMVEAFAGELRAGGLDGQQILASAATFLPSLRLIGDTVFRRWTTFLE